MPGRLVLMLPPGHTFPRIKTVGTPMTYVLKKYALALAFAGACGLASASTDIPASGAGNQSFSTGVLNDTWTLAHSGIAGAFVDNISFTLTSFSDFSFSSSTMYLKNNGDIASFGVQLDGAPLAVTTIGKFEFAGDDFQLAAGSHMLQISGLGMLVNGGSYQLQIAAALVPEPESYALLLAGLGLLGAIARRRSKSMPA